MVHMALSLDLFEEDIDDIFSSVIGPVFSVERTPHPLTNNTKTLDPSSLFTHSLPHITPLAKQPTLTPSYRAPLPQIRRAQQQEDGKTKYRFNRVAQNERQLNQLLEEPIHTIPNFDVDYITETTRKFDELQAEYKKRRQEDKKIEYAIRNSRRQLPRRVKIFPNGIVQLEEMAEDTLLEIAQAHHIDYYKMKDANAFAWINGFFVTDVETLNRAVSLMEQFVYGARYKFLYAQHLKERYAKHIKYRLGYTFGVLENLQNQFYSCYYTMVSINREAGHNTNSNLETGDSMAFLKLYERTIGIQVEFRAMTDFLSELEFMRLAYESDKKEDSNMKEKIYKVLVHIDYGSKLFYNSADDIFASIIGPLYDVKITPHATLNITQTVNLNAAQQWLETKPPHKYRNYSGDHSRKSFDETLKARKTSIQRLQLPHNKEELDMMLQEEEPIIPKYDEDVFKLTTQRFDQVHERYLKRLERLKIALSRPARRRNFQNDRLAKLKIVAEGFNLKYANLKPVEKYLFNVSFEQDVKTLQRSRAMMAQFIYSARYKFLYAQKLKERYVRNVKYRIGYTLAIIEDIRIQMHRIYQVMQIHEYGDGVRRDDSVDILYYISLYQKSLRMMESFRDITEYLDNLEKERVELYNYRVEEKRKKDKIAQ